MLQLIVGERGRRRVDVEMVGLFYGDECVEEFGLYQILAVHSTGTLFVALGDVTEVVCTTTTRRGFIVALLVILFGGNRHFRSSALLTGTLCPGDPSPP